MLNKVGVLLFARFYPAPAVFKALTGSRILAAQKSAAHAAVDDVVPGRIGQRDQRGAGAGHDVTLANASAASLSRHHSCVSASLFQWL